MSNESFLDQLDLTKWFFVGLLHRLENDVCILSTWVCFLDMSACHSYEKWLLPYSFFFMCDSIQLVTWKWQSQLCQRRPCFYQSKRPSNCCANAVQLKKYLLLISNKKKVIVGRIKVSRWIAVGKISIYLLCWRVFFQCLHWHPRELIAYERKRV